MDINTAIARIFAESLAIGNGILSQLIYLPANATGPFDSNITLTVSGADLVRDIAGTAALGASILTSTFETLF